MFERWNRFLVALAALAALVWGGDAQAAPFRPGAGRANATADRVIVRWRGAPPATDSGRFRTMHRMRHGNTTVVRVPAGSTPDATIAALSRDPRVLYAEKNVRRRLLTLGPPNEPIWNAYDPRPDYSTRLMEMDISEGSQEKFLWALEKIRARQAWNIFPGQYYTAQTKPANPLKVAVLDTGLDLAHPEWINAGGTSPDAAQGGQIDVAHAVSLLNGSTTPVPNTDDFVGHGTHTAGIICAAANNGGTATEGAVGLAYSAQIMPIQVLDSAEGGSVEDIINGIYYAVDNGAQVINISLGDYDYSQAEQDAIDYAWERGVLVVAAAGNDGDKGNPVIYPAACHRVLAVGATDLYDTRAAYSNYGDYVGVSAPGGYLNTVEVDFMPDFPLELPVVFSVWSTTPTHPFDLQIQPDGMGGMVDDYLRERYDYAPGTSVAAPFVAGLAALYAQKNGITRSTPRAAERMYQAIQRGAINAEGTPGGGWSRNTGFGRIDAVNTLNDVRARSAVFGCIVGRISSYDAPVSNITITARKDGTVKTAVTRIDGGFRLANLTEGEWTVSVSLYGQAPVTRKINVLPGVDNFGAEFAFPIGIVYGDVDDNGVTDILDAVAAMRMLAGTDPFSIEKITRADVAPWAGTGGRLHGDGEFNMADVQGILRLASGLAL